MDTQSKLQLEKYLQAGDKPQARALIENLLKQDRRDEESWFALGQLAETVEQQRKCLVRVLTINPNNLQAQQMLNQVAGPTIPSQATTTTPKVPTPPKVLKTDSLNAQQIVSKAWQIIWRHKRLWLLGFFAGLTMGRSNLNAGNNFYQGGAWLFQNIGGLFIAGNPLIISATIILAVIIWVMGNVARIGLIQEVAALETARSMPTSGLLEVLRIALHHLRPVTLMQLLLWSPYLIVNITVVIMAQSYTQQMYATFPTGGMPNIYSNNYIALTVLMCGSVVLLIPLTYIDAFAYRSIVLENLGFWQSIKRSIQIIRKHARLINNLSFLCLLLGMLASFVLVLVAVPAMFLMWQPMINALTQCGSTAQDFNSMPGCMQQALSSDPYLIALTLAANVLTAALTCIWVATQSAMFTVAYTQFAEKDRQEIVAGG